MNHYSIVFMPPGSGVTYVKRAKDLLAGVAGWYGSRNSLAHISVLEFEAPESWMNRIVAYLCQFCDRTPRFGVRFDRVGRLGNAVCFLPTERSKYSLAYVMAMCTKRFPVDCHFSKIPHMTIGRRLNDEQLRLACKCFASEIPDLMFDADGLYLRQFNERRGQYDVIGKFEFHGKDPLVPRGGTQQRLFD